ncbi:NAD(P)-dependent dehydrogenase (short-subunit alcohol dehydrogenase family) [Actinoplanes tereljensis]|uniref:3-oxoacyl-ACP reductase n=1 Tax=Paractinoplanes tereljensis TaxID=571912 RepID=A0A919NJ66_9ACTN|nr:SDR family oxidoreductase [Actinoplanes tereljensis]GIF19674.1 3-oxoacyl-ACP reductase [Actinoplanes tereljensis]
MSKIALITGGNRGLGRATALALIEDGVEVIYTYRDDPGEKIDAVALKLTVGDLDSYPAFVDELRTVLREKGREDFDFLINNAGIGKAGKVADFSVEDFDELVNVHFRGVFFLTQKLLPVIKDGGRIINLSTGLARFTGEGIYAAYGSVKGAIEVFTRYLAKELGPRQISVNVVAPGATGTDFGGGALRENDQVRQHLSGVIAFGRVGEPEDIAGVMVGMLADNTKWITGQRIEASGGMLL